MPTDAAPRPLADVLRPDTTSHDALVNETMIKRLGVSSSAAILGKRIRVKGSDRTIVGVVKDFRSGDLHQPILPLTLINDLPHSRVAMLRLSPTASGRTRQAIQRVWDTVLPDQVYHAQDLVDLMAGFMALERLLAGLVQAFAWVAIGLSCLGLYGLVTFLSEAKAKEISVRRVLGARTSQLLWLLGREFGKLLGLSFLVAAPLGAVGLVTGVHGPNHRKRVAAGCYAYPDEPDHRADDRASGPQSGSRQSHSRPAKRVSPLMDTSLIQPKRAYWFSSLLIPISFTY